MNYVIRPMAEGDVAEVCQIEQSVFSLPWSEKSFRDAMGHAENIYLVCDLSGKVAGYCGMWTVFGEGNITNIAVASEYRRMGIGKALMQALEIHGKKKEVTAFFLEVRESNQAARHLYEKMGYVKIGVRKRFYERPVEDAVIMSKMYESPQTL